MNGAVTQKSGGKVRCVQVIPEIPYIVSISDAGLF